MKYVSNFVTKLAIPMIDIYIYYFICCSSHDDVMKWKYFPCYWPFVRRIHRSPVNSPHKCQWRGALKLSLICVWMNGWVNIREAGDLRRHRAHYGVIVMTAKRKSCKNIAIPYIYFTSLLCYIPITFCRVAQVQLATYSIGPALVNTNVDIISQQKT